MLRGLTCHSVLFITVLILLAIILFYHRANKHEDNDEETWHMGVFDETVLNEPISSFKVLNEC